jgi:hypothetical protein
MPSPVLFWLFAESFLILGALTVAAYIIFPKAMRKFFSFFLPKIKRKHAKEMVSQYDMELKKHKKLGKKALKGNKRQKVNKFQRFLSKLPIIKRAFIIRPLKKKEIQKRISKMEDYLRYIHKKEPNYNPTYYTSMISQTTATREFEPSHFQHNSSQNLSEKQFVKGDKYTGLAKDGSHIKTFSTKVQKEFYDLDKSNKSNSKDALFNRMYIYTQNNSQNAVEVISAKDKYMFYKVGATMLREIIDNVKDEIYPLKIDNLIIDSEGKEIAGVGDYTKPDLEKLVNDFDKKIKYYETEQNKDRSNINNASKEKEKNGQGPEQA